MSGAVRFGPRDEKPPMTSPASGCVRNRVLSSVTSTTLSSCSSWSSSWPSACPIMTAGIPTESRVPDMMMRSDWLLNTTAAIAPAASTFATLSWKSQAPRWSSATCPSRSSPLTIDWQASYVEPPAASPSSASTSSAVIGPSSASAGVKLASRDA